VPVLPELGHTETVKTTKNAEDPWQMGLPISGGGSGRSDRRSLAQGKARCGCGKSLFQQGNQTSWPATETVTLDGYAASHRAVREMKTDGIPPEDTKVRSSKYLNNVIEQEHRHIKSRTNVMLGFKRFRSAATTISGIELIHRIRKQQFDLSALALEDIAAPSVWNVVLFNR
jgi:DDE domain